MGLLQSFPTTAQTEILRIRFAIHTHTHTHTREVIPTSLQEQDSTIATIPPGACPYT